MASVCEEWRIRDSHLERIQGFEQTEADAIVELLLAPADDERPIADLLEKTKTMQRYQEKWKGFVEQLKHKECGAFLPSSEEDSPMNPN